MSSYVSKNYAQAGQIGSGGFGAVLRVFDEDTGEEFAAKVFESSDEADHSSEALRELSFLSLLTQSKAPHCVVLHDFTYELSSRRGLIVIMPLMKRDLSHAIDGSDLRASARLSVARDLFSALSYLHGSSPPIVHRDVKPENVLLDEKNRAFLADFSFARFISDGVPPPSSEKSKRSHRNASKELSQKGSGVLGTPTYIAPEVFLEALPHPSVDCWAAGVVLLELFQNSRLPVDRDKAALKILRGARDALSEKPVPLLIKGLLAEEPSTRTTAVAALESDAFSKFEPKDASVAPAFVDYHAAARKVSSEVSKICKRLQALVPQTSIAAEHYASVSRYGDLELLCVIAYKVYEHNPEADEDLLDFLNSRKTVDDLIETEERLLMEMRGCLLVPFASH